MAGDTLLAFLRNPSSATATMLLMIPGFQSIALLELEAIRKDPNNSDVWRIGKWIYKRASAVRDTICHYGYPEPDYTICQGRDDWKKV